MPCSFEERYLLASVTEDIRVKMEVASKPPEETEEQDTEIVDLSSSFSFCLRHAHIAL